MQPEAIDNGLVTILTATVIMKHFEAVAWPEKERKLPLLKLQCRSFPIFWIVKRKNESLEEEGNLRERVGHIKETRAKNLKIGRAL